MMLGQFLDQLSVNKKTIRSILLPHQLKILKFLLGMDRSKGWFNPAFFMREGLTKVLIYGIIEEYKG